MEVKLLRTNGDEHIRRELGFDLLRARLDGLVHLVVCDSVVYRIGRHDGHKREVACSKSEAR